MKRWFAWFVAGMALLPASSTAATDVPKDCADAFRTPEFQSLDFRETYQGTYLYDLLGSLKGQTCTIDELEKFINGRHAPTFDRNHRRIHFRATLNSSGFLFKKIIGIGASIEGERITHVYVMMENP